MIAFELQTQIRTLVQEKQYRRVRDSLTPLAPIDVAELLRGLTGAEKAIVFRILPKEFAREVFEDLEAEDQKSLLAPLGTERFTVLLNEMAADERTAMLEDLPPLAARQLVALLSREEREIALALLGYPENSVGRLMTPDYVVLKKEWSVALVLENIRNHGRIVFFKSLCRITR